MKPSEFRKYPRVQVKLAIEYTCGGGTLRGRVLTLGGGGLFLELPEPVASGTELTLRFRPAKHLPVVEAKARVCYQVPGEGVGIEFTEMSPEHRDIILRLIHHRLADNRRLPRTLFATQVEHEGGVFIGFTRDISVGGMFIETKETVAAGSKLKLRFNLGDGGPVVIATGEARYTVPKLGIGVQFLALSPDDQRRIDRFVAQVDRE
jgi:c-di-GMP-binding flagellar brake protein YcgR